MEFSSRMPKIRKFGTPKNNKRFNFKLKSTNRKLIYRGAENLSHPELRELQRYGTLCVNRKKVVNAIREDKAIIIKEKDNVIIALIRYSNRYYVVVMDTKINVIKTFLPDNICNFSDYVQKFIDKENATRSSLTA